MTVPIQEAAEALAPLLAAGLPSLISQHVIGDPAFSGDWDAVARDHVRLVDLLDAGDAAVAGQAFFVHAVGQGEFPARS